MNELCAVATGYFVGAIPFAYIIARARKGIDIRTGDIGNVGAGSVIRAVGLKEGVVTLVCDIGKGCAAIGVAQLLGVELYWLMAAGALAVAGHIFPVYIGFRGGQGVATAIGVLLAVATKAMLLTLAVIGVVLLLNLRRGASRRLFLAVACGAPFLPIFVYAIDRSLEVAAYSMALVAFIALKNLKRLRHPRSITERLLGEREE